MSRYYRQFPLALVFCFAATCASLLPARLSAQQAGSAGFAPAAQGNRVASQPDFGPRTQLSGHLPAWANVQRQSSQAVDLSTPLQISLVLQRDSIMQAAFDKLLASQQDSSSPLYHHWLTPQQVGATFGPTQSDLDAVTSWAASEGLTVASIDANRLVVRLTGTTAQVGSAFRTSFGFFDTNGRSALSAISEASIPSALLPVISGVHGLSEVRLEPHFRRSDRIMPASKNQPQVTLSGGVHLLLPNDFATIYDITGVYSGGDTGATIGSKAQHIAIIGRSRVASGDISNYESLAALPSIQPNVVLAGADPGTTNDGDQDEATLDVDRVVGTAPGAQVDLVISADSRTTDGVDTAIQYNINTLLDPVMTISFGSCEAEDGQSASTFYNTEFATAASEGISTFVSSGDSGVAGCDTGNAAPPSSQVASINALCSSGNVTCVGGTEFNDFTSPSTYWSSTNSANGYESALSYIPEGAWNEPTETTTSSSGAVTTTYIASATGGGASVYITKPSFQSGTGVPADGFRDVPDVAFSASDHDGYIACLAYAGDDCSTYIAVFSGTSAAAPSMAGIAALLNTKLGVAQGNANPLLYKVATSTSSAFHDATIASSGVSSCTASTPSMCNNSTPSPRGLSGGQAGYLLTTGFDESTGLGSLDVNAFLNAAINSTSPTFSLTPTSTTLTLSAGATTGNTDMISVASLNSFAGTVALTCTVTNTNGTAAGSCSLTPTSSTLTSGSTSTSTLTINTTAGTSGALSVTVTGTSGSTVVTSSAISVTVTTPTFTLTPGTSPFILASGTATNNTDSIAIASVAGFAGNVALSCVVNKSSGTAAGTCSLTPASVTLTSGGTANSFLTLTTTGYGLLNVVITGTSGSIFVSSTLQVTVTNPSATYILTPAATSISFSAGSSTANTNGITVSSANSYQGSVSLSCTIALNTGTATLAPTCSIVPNIPVNLTLVAPSVTSTVNIASQASTTTCTTANQVPSPWGTRGTVLAAFVLVLIPFRRRKAMRRVMGLCVLICGLGWLSGCGEGGTPPSTACTNHVVAGTTAGTYTVTVTGSGSAAGASGSTTVNTTFTVTIN